MINADNAPDNAHNADYIPVALRSIVTIEPAAASQIKFNSRNVEMKHTTMTNYPIPGFAEVNT